MAKRKSRRQQIEDKVKRDPKWAAETILRLIAKYARAHR